MSLIVARIPTGMLCQAEGPTLLAPRGPSADLILEGLIKSTGSYLVENGAWIDTGYEIEPTRVVIERKPRVPARTTGTDRYHILDGAGAFIPRSGSYAPMLKTSAEVPVERSQFLRDLEGEVHAPSVR